MKVALRWLGWAFSALACLSGESAAYRQLTDSAGSNVKLPVREIKVYVSDDPQHSGRRAEVTGALDKWKTALAPYGITLALQAGDPPTTPLDKSAYIKQQKDYNADTAANPDMTKYPEVQKSIDKENTLSIYFRTSEEIAKIRDNKGTEKGALNWLSDLQSNQIVMGDMFLPTDPPGGTEEIRKLMLHNIAMHEFGHMAGLDHNTRQQTGKVMTLDATTYTERLVVETEETAALRSIYGAAPAARAQSSAQPRAVESLPPQIQALLPGDLAQVWEYVFEIRWEGGEPMSFVQIEVGNAPIFLASGTGSVSDWLVQRYGDDKFDWSNGTYREYAAFGLRAMQEEVAAVDDLLEFFADGSYLGSPFSTGQFLLYSSAGPTEGLIFTAAGSVVGSVPSRVPAGSTWALFVLGSLAALVHRERARARVTGVPRHRQ